MNEYPKHKRDEMREGLISYMDKLIKSNNIRIIDVIKSIKRKLENESRLSNKQLRLVMQFVENEAWSNGYTAETLTEKFSFLTKKEKKEENPSITLEDFMK